MCIVTWWISVLGIGGALETLGVEHQRLGRHSHTSGLCPSPGGPMALSLYVQDGGNSQC